jgi:hypothetical protein
MKFDIQSAQNIVRANVILVQSNPFLSHTKINLTLSFLLKKPTPPLRKVVYEVEHDLIKIQNFIIPSRIYVILYGIWNGDSICWPLTASNYSAITLQIKVFSVCFH